jgi:GNAT superfamily N-acetyltransferase
LGGALIEQAETFARERNADMLAVTYFESQDNSDAPAFLSQRGFMPCKRILHFHFDLAKINSALFADSLNRVAKQGIRLFSYAETDDTSENRRRIHALETAARSMQPFQEADGYLPPDFEEWEDEMSEWEYDNLFLAAFGDEWVGLNTGFGFFTGVHPNWQGRGIATALMVKALTLAKRYGAARIETENHEDNHPMIAVNRKLGFEFDPAEVNCKKTLR